MIEVPLLKVLACIGLAHISYGGKIYILFTAKLDNVSARTATVEAKQACMNNNAQMFGHKTWCRYT